MSTKLTVTLNYAATNLRREKLQDKEYLVIPTVMILEGVHNGSFGPLYYSESTLSKNPEAWNHKPVVVYHPASKKTATTVENLEKTAVGLIMNTTWDSAKRKLRCEAWVEEKRVQKIDPRVMMAINAGALMEVSTGLFSDCLQNKGTWNGEDYVGEVVNIVPDHLAILPDQKGACSIRDGAGLFQLNSEHPSDQSIWGRLQTTLSTGIEKSKLVAVLNGELVYETEGQHYAAPYEIDDEEGLVTINIENQKEVLKLTGFAPLLTNKVEEESPHIEEPKMKKSALVDGLIANEATQFDESDREFLENLEEDQLAKLAPVENEEEDEEEEEYEDEEYEEEEEEDEDVVENVESWIEKSKCPELIANVIRESLQNQEKAKADITQKILANKNSKFSEEDLSGLNINQLQKICDSIVVENKSDDSGSQSYDGQQGINPGSLRMNAEAYKALGDPLGIPTSTAKS